MSEETRYCPFCGEEVKAIAKKCKHCGKWLDTYAKEKQEFSRNQQIIKTVETITNTPWRKLLHGFSLFVCTIASFCGLEIFFKGEIVIIEACIYMCEWLIAIFFLLLWKFTSEK